MYESTIARLPTIFFTGYPGFLGSELLPRVLKRSSDTTALCIVQPKFAAMARERARPFGDRVRFVEGDITRAIEVDGSDVTEIYHLAAIYDLSVKRAAGMRVNVVGARHVLDFAERSRAHLHYVSTCYVSGRHEGVFAEDDLDVGQCFNNYYEETKFLAEAAVRNRGVPATIYRPSVVAGDSRTGETQKFDGPYYVLQWLLRFPVLPVAGDPKKFTFNVVPREFVIEAMARLSARREAKCYQIADPNPLTVDETIDVLARAAGRRVIRVPLPKWLAKFSLAYVPGVYRLMRIPPAAVDYFVHPTTYDTTNAQHDLGFAPPSLADYAETLVRFFRAHPEISSAAMA